MANQPKQHTKVSGTWKVTDRAYVRASGIWGKVVFAWQKLSGVWTRIAAYHEPVPAGTIVLFAGTATPTGWTKLTDSDDRMIVGAGSTYAALDTGGADTFNFSGSTDASGGHINLVGDSEDDIWDYYTSSGGQYPKSVGENYTRGGFSHTYSATETTKDAHKNFILIKADADTLLPADAIVLFAASPIEGRLTNTEIGTDKFIRGGAAYGGTGGSSTGNSNVASSTSGTHGHGGGVTPLAPDVSSRKYLLTGAHSHTVTLSWTLGTYGIGLSAWKAASDNTSVERNVIAMWEGSTPPTDWVLCDGTNGTPDMRDKFLKIVDVANHGTTYGNSSNNAAVNLTTDSQGGHSHYDGSSSGTRTNNVAHGRIAGVHPHSGSFNSVILQKYYALTFIMKVS